MDTFNEQREKLHDELLQMGNLVCDALKMSIEAFKNYDLAMAKKVIEVDLGIDAAEKVVEARALKMLMDKDLTKPQLRAISSVLKVITDMERVGDQAADIAEILGYYEKEPMKTDLSHVYNMAEEAFDMVKQSIDAFTNMSLGTAVRVIKADDGVDSMFSEIRDEVIDRLVMNRDLADEAVDIIMLVKYLERIADHAVNIAEWAIFARTGKHQA